MVAHLHSYPNALPVSHHPNTHSFSYTITHLSDPTACTSYWIANGTPTTVPSTAMEFNSNSPTFSPTQVDY